ncbi:MAG: nitronate monooxygenase [Alphaproteobacteria bacterium]|nr:nitronate monooxygenase [Alphaproteobacteria bacterium]
MSWTSNKLTDLLGIRYPIIQAPMAGSTTPELAAAVTNAGGLGSLGCAFLNGEQFAEQCAAMRQTTNGAYNVNFFTHDEPGSDETRGEAMRGALQPYYEEMGLGEVPDAKPSSPSFGREQLDAVLAASPPIVSFHFGVPDAAMMRAVKDSGAIVLSSATTVEEAKQLEAAGVDAVIAQGFEAGGHRGTFAATYEAGCVGTLALVPQIVDAVDVPVIASGGIADGRGIAAALALGAQGVQLGTAFLTCPESAAHEVYRRALVAGRDDATRITSAFSGRPARGLDNRYIRDMAGREDMFPDFPINNTLTGPLRKASAEAGREDFMSLWSGQAAALSKSLPAAELVETLVAETEEVLSHMKGF